MAVIQKKEERMLELKKVSEKQVEKRSHICLPCDPICTPNLICTPMLIIDDPILD